jgi:Tfp pilus assembly protein PilF
MSRNDDWYTRTAWTLKDAEDFERRLARSRGQRTQRLITQAEVLAGTGKKALADPAIALATRYLAEEPDGIWVTRAHLTIASARTSQGDYAGAVRSYLDAVRAEKRRPNVVHNAYLDFAWFVATRGLTEAFDAALKSMSAARKDDLLFPIDQYKYFGALALIAAADRQPAHAKKMARNALEAISRSGPFATHRDLGVVRGIKDDIRRSIERIAGKLAIGRG